MVRETGEKAEKKIKTQGDKIEKLSYFLVKIRGMLATNHSVRFWGFLSKNYFSFKKQLIYHQNHY